MDDDSEVNFGYYKTEYLNFEILCVDGGQRMDSDRWLDEKVVQILPPWKIHAGVKVC